MANKWVCALPCFRGVGKALGVFIISYNLLPVFLRFYIFADYGRQLKKISDQNCLHASERRLGLLDFAANRVNHGQGTWGQHRYFIYNQNLRASYAFCSTRALPSKKHSPPSLILITPRLGS